jgi:type II secretory pathway pseudopilin PulG
MIVVALIAVIAGGAVGIMGKGSDKGKYARAEKDLDAITSALSQAIANGTSGVAINASSYTNLLSATVTTGAADVQSYLSRSIDNIKDPWGTAYQIQSSIATVYPTNNGTLKIRCVSGSSARTNPYNANIPMERVVIATN